MATITYTVTVATGTTQYGTGNRFYINGELAPVFLTGATTNVVCAPEVPGVPVEVTPVVYDAVGELFGFVEKAIW